MQLRTVGSGPREPPRWRLGWKWTVPCMWRGNGVGRRQRGTERGDAGARGRLGQKQQVSFHKVEGAEVTGGDAGGSAQDRGQPPGGLASPSGAP